MRLFIVLSLLLWNLNLAHANGFWDNYYAGRGGYGGGDITGMLQNQRNTEAIINEMRAARHQPPCSIGLLGQWQGRPRCP